MTWLLLALVAVGFILIFKSAQRPTPVEIQPLNDGPINAVEFFWRPG